VRDGRLVFFLPGESEFWLASSNKNVIPTFPLNIRFGVVSGKLVQNKGAWELNDTIWAGRIRATDVISAMAAAGVCDSTVVGMVKMQVMQFRDLPDTDVPDPDGECTSLSVGMLMRWKQASIGSVVATPKKRDCD